MKLAVENKTDNSVDVLIPGATIKIIVDPLNNESTVLLNNDIVFVLTKNILGINIGFNLTMLSKAIESLKKN